MRTMVPGCGCVAAVLALATPKQGRGRKQGHDAGLRHWTPAFPRSHAWIARLPSVSPYVVVAAVVLVGLLLFVAAMGARSLLAPRAPTRAKLTTYESGVDPVGQGWAQTQIRYFVYAFLYVIFAVDAVYLFPWALVVRSADLGVASLVEIAIFIGVLVIGLAHAARRGLLRWF